MYGTYKVEYAHHGTLIIEAKSSFDAAYRAAELWDIGVRGVLKHAEIKKVAAGAGTPNGKEKNKSMDSIQKNGGDVK